MSWEEKEAEPNALELESRRRKRKNISGFFPSIFLKNSSETDFVKAEKEKERNVLYVDSRYARQVQPLLLQPEAYSHFIICLLYTSPSPRD